MKVLALLGVLFVFGVSCTRAKKDTADIVFEVPPAVQQKSSFELLSVNTDIDGQDNDFEFFDEDWSTVAPTGIDDGAYPINCYAVMVGGPEGDFKKNYCGRTNADNEDVIDKMFEFGPWIGAVPASTAATGTQIKLEVTAGADRVFYLVGFHALSTQACRDFKTGHPVMGALTRPLIIGEVGKVNLEPGATSTVIVPRVFNTDRWFDDCKFTDASAESGDYNAHSIGIAKITRPESSILASTGTHTGSGMCTPFKIKLMDEFGNGTRYNGDVSVKLKGCVSIDNDPPVDCYDSANPATLNTYFKTFASYNECGNSTATDGVDSFVVRKDDKEITRWFRSPQATDDSVWLTTENTVGLAAEKPVKYLVREASDLLVRVDGPKNVLPDTCYKFHVARYRHSGMPDASSSDLAYVRARIKRTANSAWEYVPVNTEPDCTMPLTEPGVGTAMVTSWNSNEYYVKFPEAAQARFEVENMTDDVDRILMAVNVKKGSASPHRLRFMGPAALMRNTCRPVTLYLVNEFGAPVKHTGAENMRIMLSPNSAENHINSGDLHFYMLSNCSGTEYDMAYEPTVSVTTPKLEIMSGYDRVTFFVRQDAASNNQGHRRLQFTDGSKLKGLAEFELFGF